MKFIEENIPQEDEEDTEEVLVRSVFKEVNVVKISKEYVTINIPNKTAETWDKILMKHFGRPKVRSSKF